MKLENAVLQNEVTKKNNFVSTTQKNANYNKIFFI